jgi:hypothetical protein
MVGAPLLLGSLWGLAWLGLFVPLLAARALGEEVMLTAGWRATPTTRAGCASGWSRASGDPACDGGGSPLTGLTFSTWTIRSMANRGQGPPVGAT